MKAQSHLLFSATPVKSHTEYFCNNKVALIYNEETEKATWEVIPWQPDQVKCNLPDHTGYSSEP